jgi:Protein of unknown function (DUF3800)
MDVFFADDSRQTGVRQGMGQVVAIGGVFVEDPAIRPLAAAIDAIAVEAGIPKGTELKWSPPRGSWIHQKLHGDERQNCYARILTAAQDHRVRSVVVCCDTGRMRVDVKRAFAMCVDYLFERVTMHLKDRDTTAIMVADRPGGGGRDENEFLSDFVELIESGTQYADPDRVLLNVLTTPSHLVRHLQLADLITGITAAMVCGAYDYAPPLFRLVKPLLIKNNNDCIGGTGLKVFPNDIVNLYYWVLQENLLHRGGGARAYRLPSPLICYAQDELRA